jgi:transposase-like protein
MIKFLIKLFSNKTQGEECPHCGSDNTEKSLIKSYDNFCKDCSKWF